MLFKAPLGVILEANLENLLISSLKIWPEWANLIISNQPEDSRFQCCASVLDVPPQLTILYAVFCLCSIFHGKKRARGRERSSLTRAANEAMKGKFHNQNVREDRIFELIRPFKLKKSLNLTFIFLMWLCIKAQERTDENLANRSEIDAATLAEENVSKRS